MVEPAKRANRTVKDVMIREVLPVMQDGALRGVVTDRGLVARAMTRDVRPSSVPQKCGWTPVLASRRAVRSRTGVLMRPWRKWRGSRSDGCQWSMTGEELSGC
jgi:hypothetical protein